MKAKFKKNQKVSVKQNALNGSFTGVVKEVINHIHGFEYKVKSDGDEQTYKILENQINAL